VTLPPAYGETPLPGDEFDALVPSIKALVEDSPTKSAVYDIEQRIQIWVTEDLLQQVLNETLPLTLLLTDHFVRNLHRLLYGDIWQWAGIFRRHEMNIGVPPSQVAVELKASLESLEARWQMTKDWSAKELGLAAHAEMLRVHPFSDGNGRTSRLLADLVYLCTQETVRLETFDWEIDKKSYVTCLRDFDNSRDPSSLARLVGTRPLDG
jgi:fido (protein-threonine AMPylation protein)